MISCSCSSSPPSPTPVIFFYFFYFSIPISWTACVRRSNVVMAARPKSPVDLWLFLRFFLLFFFLFWLLPPSIFPSRCVTTERRPQINLSLLYFSLSFNFPVAIYEDTQDGTGSVNSTARTEQCDLWLVVRLATAHQVPSNERIWRQTSTSSSFSSNSLLEHIDDEIDPRA